MSNFALKFRTLLLISGGLIHLDTARAQLADEFNPPRANCCLATFAKGLAGTIAAPLSRSARPEFDPGDHVHPDDKGNAKMAEAIDLAIFSK